jgi:hypothetical protein
MFKATRAGNTKTGVGKLCAEDVMPDTPIQRPMVDEDEVQPF